MRQKQLGIWRSWTWAQTGEAVREIAGGLMHLGFQRGDTASIQANTVVEWVLADLAILSCGGVSNGIYPTDAPPQVQYLCEDSRTSILFVEDDEQLDKALEVRPQLPGAAQDRRVRHGRPARPARPRRDEPGAAARAGPRVQPRSIPTS